jgi:hypothetical protein
MEQRYQELLTQLEDEDRVPTELIPAKKSERIRAVQEHQKELEAELEMRFPALYKKIKRLRPPTYMSMIGPSPSYSKDKNVLDSAFEAKAPLVEPLSRGLAKMQEAGMMQGPMASDHKGAYPYGHGSDKLGEQWPTPDDYDEIEKDEMLRNDPAFQQAGSRMHDGAGGDYAGDDLPPKRGGRGQLNPQASFWKRLRPSAK